MDVLRVHEKDTVEFSKETVQAINNINVLLEKILNRVDKLEEERMAELILREEGSKKFSKTDVENNKTTSVKRELEIPDSLYEIVKETNRNLDSTLILVEDIIGVLIGKPEKELYGNFLTNTGLLTDVAVANLKKSRQCVNLLRDLRERCSKSVLKRKI